MKESPRRKVLLLLAMVALLIAVYFLPITFSGTDEVVIHAPYERIWDQVSLLQRWKAWWPDTSDVQIVGDTIFRTSAVEYYLRNKQALQLVLQQQNKPVYHILSVVPEGKDTVCILRWKKVSYLRTALSGKISALFGDRSYGTAQLLQRIKEGVEDPVKYYGFPIRIQPVEDTFVLVKEASITKKELADRKQELYASLQQYLDAIRYGGRAEKMFHVDSIAGDSLRVMAGISLAKPVEAKPPFRLMTMPKAHMVVGEYEGDYKKVYRVHQAISNFMKDHGIVPIAVVYEKILNEPRTAQDSLHVKVKAYHPSMIP